MSRQLEIMRTEVRNGSTGTAAASTVSSVEYRYDGETGNVSAGEGEALVLIVDGCQEDLLPGAKYGVERGFSVRAVRVYRTGGPSAAPWSGAREEEKAVYWFRQALLVDGGRLVEDASLPELLSGGRCDAHGAWGVALCSNGAHFNGILLDHGTRFEVSGSRFLCHGDGGDDLSGWGAMLMADNRSVLELNSSSVETAGAIRCALYVDNGSVANVRDTVIYTKETEDSFARYASLVPAMMKRVPFALGMEGTVRSLNVMADGQGRFKNCIVVSTGWGALSTDSGTAYDVCGTFALDVEDTLSGIGTLEVAREGKAYTAKKTVNGVTYGFTAGGSGYVTYADSGVHNRYRNVEFYSPDYIQVMGSGRSGSAYIGSYLSSGHTAFMSQQSSGGVFELIDTRVDAVDALLQIKSGAANTGFAALVCDRAQVRFSGASARTRRGILAELVESDDAGNPGVTTYTIDDRPEEAKATRSAVPDSSVLLKNGDYRGDVFNSIYSYRQALDLTLEHAVLTGLVSASRAVHVDPEGKRVPNGTVLNAFLGSEAFDHADYTAEKGGMSGDCRLIGHFRHTPAPVLNDPVNVTLRHSRWNVAGEGWLGALDVEALSDLTAEAPVTLHVKALTVAGRAYADGRYVEGSVAVEVDPSVIEAEDSGIVDAGQTYGNVRYTILAVDENGRPDSGAFTVKRQNYVDGKLYFTLTCAEGRSVVSLSAEGGDLARNTAGDELEAYEHVVTPKPGAAEMRVTAAVS